MYAGGQLEKAWGWGKADCDSTATMKDLVLVAESQVS